MAIQAANDNDLYRVPGDLAVAARPALNLLIVGSCLVGGLLDHFRGVSDCRGNYVLFNNVGNLPKSPPQPLSAYDLQIVQVPLRSILPDGSFERLAYSDVEGHERLFRDAEERLFQLLSAAMGWNAQTGLATLVVNLFQPQQSPLGRLLPWYNLRNIAYFVARLNETLEREVRRYKNSFVLNFDEIAATYGRKFIQDDVLWPFNHGAMLNDYDHGLDQRRLHPPVPASHHYTLRCSAFQDAVYKEIVAMHATLRGQDAVKLVIVDLDDTLWRGVVVEEGHSAAENTEGWPIGLAEALTYLKKRGVLLAIVSKNDEATIRAMFGDIFGLRLLWEDFAAVRINWRPKSENIEEVIGAVNVLPGSVVFIDDNPVERAQVEANVPGIRTLGTDLYYLRRILLWSAETQVSAVTDESVRRTDMVRAQIDREDTRKRMTREEFIASLDIKLDLAEIAGLDDPRFPRALELVNKTNQFNTTGERRTLEETKTALDSGTRLFAFEVGDKFTRYGLVGVVIVARDCIEQFVMSCRVIGLDVETAVVARLVKTLRTEGNRLVRARYRDTGRNGLCADLFERAGFSMDENGMWTLPIAQ